MQSRPDPRTPRDTTDDLAFDEPATAPSAGADRDALDVRIEPRFEWGSAPAGADPVMSVLLTLTCEGPPLASRPGEPAAHVILALDVSASMNHADKYPVLTRALERMLSDLQGAGGREVLLSVVAFARGAETLLREVRASSLTPRDLVRAVDECGLRFSNYTDLGGGLSRAGRIAYDSHRANPALPIRICLLTDGRPQDVPGIRRRLEVLARVPVDVDAFGFGADADVQLLSSVVTGHRGGTVKHVRPETLTDAYGRLAEVSRSIVAKRSLLRVETARGVVGGAAYRFRPARHAYGPDAFAQGRTFEADLGTLESGRAYSLLFQVRLPQTTGDDTEIGHVLLRVPGHGGGREFRCTLAIPRHRDAQPIVADPVVVEAREVLEALDTSDPKALLRSLRARRKIYLSELRDPYLLEVVDKAISHLEESGTLEALSNNERAALTAHTATAGGGKPRPNRREYTFG